MATKTIFSRIIDGEIPARIVHADEHVVAFHDVNPVAPVHVLVVPRKVIAKIEDMEAEDAGLVGHMVWTATRIAKQLGLEDGYRLVLNDGAQGGQTVFHVHLHLLGGRDLTWPPG
jgi:histidine triad (HIT) family protein